MTTKNYDHIENDHFIITPAGEMLRQFALMDRPGDAQINSFRDWNGKSQSPVGLF
jgi:hypothetical protein